jgi:hypothetical protein
MVVHVERTAFSPFSYRLTTHALVSRAVLVGALAAVALSGECVSRFRWMHMSVAGRGTAVGQPRDRMSPASDSR